MRFITLTMFYLFRKNIHKSEGIAEINHIMRVCIRAENLYKGMIKNMLTSNNTFFDFQNVFTYYFVL